MAGVETHLHPMIIWVTAKASAGSTRPSLELVCSEEVNRTQQARLDEWAIRLPLPYARKREAPCRAVKSVLQPLRPNGDIASGITDCVIGQILVTDETIHPPIDHPDFENVARQFKVRSHLDPIRRRPHHPERNVVEEDLRDTGNLAEIEEELRCPRGFRTGQIEALPISRHARIISYPDLGSLRPVLEPIENHSCRPTPCGIECYLPWTLDGLFRRQIDPDSSSAPIAFSDRIDPRLPDEALKGIERPLLVRNPQPMTDSLRGQHVLELCQRGELAGKGPVIIRPANAIETCRAARTRLDELTIEEEPGDSVLVKHADMHRICQRRRVAQHRLNQARFCIAENDDAVGADGKTRASLAWRCDGAEAGPGQLQGRISIS